MIVGNYGKYRIERRDDFVFLPKFDIYEFEYLICTFASLQEAEDYISWLSIKNKNYTMEAASPTLKVIGLNYIVKLNGVIVSAFASSSEAICYLKGNKS